MKKSIRVFGFLFFIISFFCTEIFAADVTNPVKLNVNAKKIVNRLVYNNDSLQKIYVNLGWTEKTILGPTGELVITITIGALATEPKTGDLIIKVDQVDTVGDTITDGLTMEVKSGWLKYITNDITKSVKVCVDQEIINVGQDDEETIDKKDLSKLRLLQDVSATTVYLFDYFSTITYPAHIIFTAILVDDASKKADARVLGVDVQTVYLNFDGGDVANPSFWLNLISSAKD